MKTLLVRLMGGLLIIVVLLWVGTLIHEMGHVIVVWLAGGTLTELNVFGVDLYPHLGLTMQSGYYGWMGYDGHINSIQHAHLMLWGSLATLITAIIAQVILWAHPLQKWLPRFMVIVVSFFWLDIFTHTLPAVGLPMYLFFGSRSAESTSEAYQGAVALGMPGMLFAVLTIAISILLMSLTLLQWRRLKQPE